MGAKKILVVDDSLTIQKVIRLALANEGYEIQAVSSGNDVISQLSLFRPQVVLIDFSIPGKSAFEIRTECLRTPDLANISFVVMSSAFENVDETKLAEYHFNGRLVKPFDPSHLRQVLDEVFKKGGPHGSVGGSKLPLGGPPPIDDGSGFIRRMPQTPSQNEPTLSFEAPKSSPPRKAPTPPPAPPPFTQPRQSSTVDTPLDNLGMRTGSNEDDIKNLTETTIKMSGLDNFQWSVNDEALKSSPPKESAVQNFESNDFDVDQMQASEPNLPPHNNYLDKTDASLQIDAVDLPGEKYTMAGDFSFDPPPAKAQSYQMQEASPYSPPYQGYQGGSLQEDSSVVPLSTEQMERILGTQLEQTLEKVARRLLPDIAEKVIREEIRKILSEPPV